jgi:hypothetical protein
MSGSAQRAAAAIAAWALRIMPGANKWWAEGMLAELAYCEPGLRALSFALGCFRAALKERLRWALLRPENRGLFAAVPAGLMFLAHATVNGSGAWPLLWPLVAGAAVTIIPGSYPGHLRHPESSSLRRCWTAVCAGSAAGSVVATIFALGAAAHLSLAGGASLEARAPVLIVGAASSLVISALAALACSAARHRLSRS